MSHLGAARRGRGVSAGVLARPEDAQAQAAAQVRAHISEHESRGCPIHITNGILYAMGCYNQMTTNSSIRTIKFEYASFLSGFCELFDYFNCMLDYNDYTFD